MLRTVGTGLSLLKVWVFLPDRNHNVKEFSSWRNHDEIEESARLPPLAAVGIEKIPPAGGAEVRHLDIAPGNPCGFYLEAVGESQIQAPFTWFLLFRKNGVPARMPVHGRPNGIVHLIAAGADSGTDSRPDIPGTAPETFPQQRHDLPGNIQGRTPPTRMDCGDNPSRRIRHQYGHTVGGQDAQGKSRPICNHGVVLQGAAGMNEKIRAVDNENLVAVDLMNPEKMPPGKAEGRSGDIPVGADIGILLTFPTAHIERGEAPGADSAPTGAEGMGHKGISLPGRRLEVFHLVILFPYELVLV